MTDNANSGPAKVKISIAATVCFCYSDDTVPQSRYLDKRDVRGCLGGKLTTLGTWKHYIQVDE